MYKKWMEEIEIQSLEWTSTVIIGFVGALFGGIVTQYALRALEIKERELRGAMQAIVGLNIVKEMLDLTQNNPEAYQESVQFKNLQKDAIEILLNATALVSKKRRRELYDVYDQISRLDPNYVSLEVLVQTLEMIYGLKDSFVEEYL